jgi:hypothetical protein
LPVARSATARVEHGAAAASGAEAGRALASGATLAGRRLVLD